MDKTISLSLPESQKVKDFLESIVEKFVKFDKLKRVAISHYYKRKPTYDRVSGVREHILKLVHYYNKLKTMSVDLLIVIWFDAH